MAKGIKKVTGGWQLYSEHDSPLGPVRKSREEVAIKDERRLRFFSRNSESNPGAKDAGKHGQAVKKSDHESAKPIKPGRHPVEPPSYMMKFPEKAEKRVATRAMKSSTRADARSQGLGTPKAHTGYADD